MTNSECTARVRAQLERSTGPTSKRYAAPYGASFSNSGPREMDARFASDCRSCGGRIDEGDRIFYSRESGATHATPGYCASVIALASDPDFAKCTRCGQERIAHLFSDGEENCDCPDGSGRMFSRDVQAPPQAPAPAPQPAQEQGIRNGIYTAIGAGGDYATIRIKTVGEESALAGKRIVSFLSGSDNENSYTGFGFYDGRELRVWGTARAKFSAAVIERYVEAFKAVAGDPSAAGFLYAQQSGNCYVCNRTLTTPESLAAGIGPICAQGGEG